MGAALRARLAECITDTHGSLSTASVRQVSESAGVSYTTLARFLLYPSGKRTNKLSRRTANAVAVALDVNASWLTDGQGTKQLGLWPILVPSNAEAVAVEDSVTHLSQVLDYLKGMPAAVQLRASRAAVSAILDSVVRAGGMVPADAYRCLMRLDALHRRHEAAS